MKPIVMLIVSGVLLLQAAASAWASEVDGPIVKWRVATYPPPRASTTGIQTIADYVKEKTNGNFTIDIGYGTFGDPKDFLDLFQIGAIQGALVQTAITGGKLPLYTVLDLPFLPLDNVEVQQAVHDAVNNDPAILKEFSAWNAIPFMSSLIPQYELTGKGKPPAAPSDLKGMRIRAQGELGHALETLGATPTTIPAPEVYVALDRGLVGAVAQPFYAIKAYRLGEIADWMTTNLSLGTTGVPFVINKKAWDALPEQYRQLLRDAREKAYAAQKAALEAEQQAAFHQLESQTKPIAFSDDALERFRKAGGQPVWEEWVAKQEKAGLPGKRILDLVLETAAKAAKH
jgi:TRAP-type C4-dicarboxylate transport system substrate-binding protein